MTRIGYDSMTARSVLKSYITRFWQVESNGPVAVSPGRWALPDGHTEWLFVLSEPLLRNSTSYGHGAYASGLALKAILSKPAGRLFALGVVFKPGCAAAALPAPAHELVGRTVVLSDLWGRPGALLAERLAEAPDFKARVAILEREIFTRLRVPDPEMLAAVALLAKDPSTTVSVLAAGTAAARRLERKFHIQVGIGPKRLARIFRLQRAVRLWEAGEAEGWADLAAAAGYADQAHLIREFSELAGTSPGGFAERARRMSEFFNTGARQAGILYEVRNNETGGSNP